MIAVEATDSGKEVDPRVRRTHREVHAAVLALLGEHGLGGVTHANVAARAAVGRATVYRHFPTRASLLVSTLEVMRPDIDVPTPTGDPAVDARALIGVVARHLNDNEMLVDMLVLLRDAEDDPEFAVAAEHVMPTSGNPVLALVTAGQRDGTIRGDLDPIVLTVSLMGPVLATRVLLRQQVTDQLLDGIVAVWAGGAVPGFGRATATSGHG